jgi:two-component system aerobic respiration control sensor histidine kinase ArcB
VINILVVEDNALIQLATKIIFRSYDCSVDFSKTGKETLSLLKKNHYDIVFLDLGLPDIDGLDLVKQIRKNKSLSKLPLIALTAQGPNEYKEKCLNAGMNAFYTKPLTSENIPEILGNFVQR